VPHFCSLGRWAARELENSWGMYREQICKRFANGYCQWARGCNFLFAIKEGCWSERRDLNSGPPVPRRWQCIGSPRLFCKRHGFSVTRHQWLRTSVARRSSLVIAASAKCRTAPGGGSVVHYWGADFEEWNAHQSIQISAATAAYLSLGPAMIGSNQRQNSSYTML